MELVRMKRFKVMKKRNLADVVIRGPKNRYYSGRG